MRYQKQRFFAGADKVGRLMASLIRKKGNKTHIAGLTVDGKKILDHRGIKEAFVSYFRNFYKPKQVEPTKIQEYLKKFKLKPITEELKAELNKEISIEESLNIIKNLKLNKSLGPDGFTILFYKKSKEELSPILKDLFASISKEKKAPGTWSKAFITLILKEQQDPMLVKSYRPISLLNEDYKIYAKIWANRLKSYLTEFIVEDQAGFLPGRQL